jgi:hypothetical protein
MKPADEKAKKGAQDITNLCSKAFSSETWLRAEATRRLLKAWQASHQILGTLRRYPQNIENFSFNDSRAFFRILRGRTRSDPAYPYDPSPYECGIPIRTSAHVLSS